MNLEDTLFNVHFCCKGCSVKVNPVETMACAGVLKIIICALKVSRYFNDFLAVLFKNDCLKRGITPVVYTRESLKV